MKKQGFSNFIEGGKSRIEGKNNP